jgi:hypothetical protein
LSDRFTHVVIPDTQVKPGVPTDHLTWIGNYIVDKFAGRDDVRLVHLGDHADMPSLSSYDKGKKSMEGRRVVADLDAANDGFAELNAPLIRYNRQRQLWKERQWWPDRHILLGNHEDRITRATEDDAQLEGLLTLDALAYENFGWEVHPYLKPVDLDGVVYAHYFVNHFTGRPLGGMALTRLKNLGHSFTMGHQQTLDHAVRPVQGRLQHGLIAGACYLHDEEYKGYQANAHWRGIVVCHEVSDGHYDPMFVSLDYLCRRYEGIDNIGEFLEKKYG